MYHLSSVLIVQLLQRNVFNRLPTHRRVNMNYAKGKPTNLKKADIKIQKYMHYNDPAVISAIYTELNEQLRNRFLVISRMITFPPLMLMHMANYNFRGYFCHYIFKETINVALSLNCKNMSKTETNATNSR